MTLRQSSIRAWEYCPAKYRATYELGLNLGEYDPNLMYGTMVHKMVEEYHLTGLGNPLIDRYTGEYQSRDFVYVEHSFSWDMPLTGITFTGTIDRIREHDLRDFKTSKVSYSQRRVDEDIQATAYLAYWYDKTGDIVPFGFDVLRKDKRANGAEFPLQVLATTRTREQLKMFELYCEQIAEAISRETEFRCTCRTQEHAVFSRTELYI